MLAFLFVFKLLSIETHLNIQLHEERGFAPALITYEREQQFILLVGYRISTSYIHNRALVEMFFVCELNFDRECIDYCIFIELIFRLVPCILRELMS